MRIPSRRNSEPYLDILNGPPLKEIPEHIVLPVSYIYTRAERIQAFFDSASEELKAYFGDYDYQIIADYNAPRKEKYKIYAYYKDFHGKTQYFIDGVGETPIKALLSVNQMVDFLRKLAIIK